MARDPHTRRIVGIGRLLFDIKETDKKIEAYVNKRIQEAYEIACKNKN
jgi:hypothetical protein